MREVQIQTRLRLQSAVGSGHKQSKKKKKEATDAIFFVLFSASEYLKIQINKILNMSVLDYD